MYPSLDMMKPDPVAGLGTCPLGISRKKRRKNSGTWSSLNWSLGDGAVLVVLMLTTAGEAFFTSLVNSGNAP
jgi:hypothetical protein